MSAKYLHMGIPMPEKKEGVNYTYVDSLKIWVSDPEDDEYKVEYLKFEVGNPFPQSIQNNVHVAFAVDNADPYIAQADEVIFWPMGDPGSRMVFIIKDGAIIELMEKN